LRCIGKRFGRKLKLPSTVAIKHGLLKLMLEDHLNAQALEAVAAENRRSQGARGVAAQ